MGLLWKFPLDYFNKYEFIGVFRWLGEIWREKIQSFCQKIHFAESWTSKVVIMNLNKNVGRNVWDLLKYKLKALEVRCNTFLHSTWISMAGLSKDSFWVLWAWHEASILQTMVRWVQMSLAAYRYRHVYGVWKSYSRERKYQHNLDEASTYLQYLNANKLYGKRMIQKLSRFGFAWEKVDGFNKATYICVAKIIWRSRKKSWFNTTTSKLWETSTNDKYHDLPY